MNELELAGDRMSIQEHDDGSATFSFDDKATGRMCGSCQLCCKLVPVLEINKGAGARCTHSRHGKGCTIYARRPNSCRTWSCRWLSDVTTAGMPRPDRCHYVIDQDYDHVSNKNNETGALIEKMSVLQVWVDPAFPKAHEAPELRAYLLHMAEKYGVGALIRFDSRRAFMLWAPTFTGDGKWHTQTGDVMARNDFEEQILAMDAPQ